MTKEERIKTLRTLKEWMPELELMAKYNTNPIDYQRYSAIDMTIKSLEQESVLDKIRAEILELRSRQNVGVLECLDIIDKYKSESEGA